MSATAVSSSPHLSVVIPCRNEAPHIERCLRSVLAQRSAATDGLEVLVADGDSTDGTREKVLDFTRFDPRVQLIDNPRRIVSTGLNVAIRASRGRVVIRMDAHTEYEPDYLCECLAALARTEADNVGGPHRARAEGRMQRAIAAAHVSSFAVGGARSHNETYDGEVDTVIYGCWRRETLFRLGLFDEELVRNQDDELNFRLKRHGGHIWQTPRIKSWYRPRSSLGALFRQYFQYGYWKVRVIQKHGRPAAVRHLVPVVFAAGILFGWLLGALHWSLSAAYLGAVLAYSAVNIGFSIKTAAGSGWDLFPMLPAVFLTYHLGYGIGFGWGMIDFLILRRHGRTCMSSLTRPSKAAGTRQERPRRAA